MDESGNSFERKKRGAPRGRGPNLARKGEAAWEKLIKSRAEQKWLQRIVSLTNAVSLKFNDGDRATCVLTSYALNEVLQHFGYSSYPLRVQAKVYPDDKKLFGTILGAIPKGDFREAARPDMWRGHLVVAIEDVWLLDATLDQANKTEEWLPCLGSHSCRKAEQCVLARAQQEKYDH